MTLFYSQSLAGDSGMNSYTGGASLLYFYHYEKIGFRKTVLFLASSGCEETKQ